MPRRVCGHFGLCVLLCVYVYNSIISSRSYGIHSVKRFEGVMGFVSR